MGQRFLIDTNIPLEIILDQNYSKHSAHILNTMKNLYITDFSLKSLFIVSQRHNVDIVLLERFLNLLLKKCKLVEVKNTNLLEIYKLCAEKNLDYDDAHLYFYCKEGNFKILTYDKHLLKYKSISKDAKLLI